jgi:hypothetical protein
VVFCGGEGLLLLIQPASIDAATSKLASTFIILPPWILRRVNDSSLAAILAPVRGLRQGWIARVLVAARPTVGAIAPTGRLSPLVRAGRFCDIQCWLLRSTGFTGASRARRVLS